MSARKTVLWVGAGCLVIVGAPTLLAVGGVAGYLYANSGTSEVAVAPLEPEYDGRTQEVAPFAFATPAPVREVVYATPAPIATPPVARVVETPVPLATAAPAATPAPVVARSSAVTASTPAPVKVAAPVKLSAKKAAPLPKKKKVKRDFGTDDLDLELDSPATKYAKPVKTPAIASASKTVPSGATAEDQAFASLFDGTPAPAAAAAPAPAPAANPKLRTIHTKLGPRQVTLDEKVVIQGSDNRTVIATLVKVEGGMVSVRMADGKVRMISEKDVVDASEL